MEKTLKLILVVIAMGTGYSVFAQESNVEIKIDERIQEELRMKNAKIDTTEMHGFRIQIFFKSDLKEAQSTIASFKSKYPEYKNQVFMLYEQPYWKVRVGNFYREIDAQKLLFELREDYPASIVVKDTIELPPLPDPYIPSTKDSLEKEEIEDK